LSLRAASIGPYTVFVWSVGWLLAFEIARQLVALGSSANVIAIDSYPRDDAASAREAAEVITHFLADYRALRNEDPKPPFAGSVDIADPWRAAIAEGLIDESELDDVKRSFRVFAANTTASARYRPPAAPVHVHWVPATSSVAKDARESARRTWTRLAQGGVQESAVDGDHYSIMRAPRVSDIARIISSEPHAKR
ncbi:MAG: thioesterase domain-containing protein, partial [Polyangiaceae bacterium]